MLTLRGLVHFTKLKRIHCQQKHGTRIILNEEILTHSRPLLRSLNGLNIYRLNLYKHANFIYTFQKYDAKNI